MAFLHLFCSLRDKITKIIETQAGIPDDVLPDRKDLMSYWVVTKRTIDDSEKHTSEASLTTNVSPSTAVANLVTGSSDLGLAGVFSAEQSSAMLAYQQSSQGHSVCNLSCLAFHNSFIEEPWCHPPMTHLCRSTWNFNRRWQSQW